MPPDRGIGQRPTVGWQRPWLLNGEWGDVRGGIHGGPPFCWWVPVFGVRERGWTKGGAMTRLSRSPLLQGYILFFFLIEEKKERQECQGIPENFRTERLFPPNIPLPFWGPMGSRASTSPYRRTARPERRPINGHAGRLSIGIPETNHTPYICRGGGSIAHKDKERTRHVNPHLATTPRT